MYGAQFEILFDAGVVEVQDITPRPLLQGNGQENGGGGYFQVKTIDKSNGKALYVIVLLNPAPPVNSPGDLAVLTLHCKAEGTSPLQFNPENTMLANADAQAISHTPQGGSVTCGPTPKTLTVAGAGTGHGTVTSSPAGINCSISAGSTSGDCTETIAHGTTVTLTATAAAGSTFAGWEGCDAVSGTRCTVVMNADKTVGATFTQISRSQFQKTYGGVRSDWANAVVATRDGGFLLVGQTKSFGVGSDLYAVKISALGQLQWSRAYGGQEFDLANAVVEAPDGGFLLVGWTWSGGLYAVKISALGQLQWSRTYGGSGLDWASHAVATPDGGFLLVGWTWSFGSGHSDMYAVKISASGQLQWSRAYGGRGIDWASHALATRDGGFLLVGGTDSFGAGSIDLYAVKIDASGNLEWSRTYGGRGIDWASHALATPDGGFLLVGGTRSFGAGLDDMYAVKIDASGNLKWSRTYGGSQWDVASAAVARPGGFLLVGGTWSFGNGGKDLYAVAIDASGNLKWSRTYGGRRWDEASAAVAAPDGGFLFVGGSWSFGAGASDLYAVKVDAQGLSGCQETTPSTQTRTPATRVTTPATQAAASTPTVKAFSTRARVPATRAQTMCSRPVSGIFGLDELTGGLDFLWDRRDSGIGNLLFPEGSTTPDGSP